MRKKALRNSLTLLLMLLGTLVGVSISTAPTRAMSSQNFFKELNYLNTSIASEIDHANKTAFYSGVPFIVASSHDWNYYMLLLETQLKDIMQEANGDPYTPFLMDKLLAKFDNALSLAINASDAATAISDYERTVVFSSDCAAPVPEYCLELILKITNLSHETLTIKEKVIGLGFLFAKAKLEMLERPRLVCNPLTVFAGKTISCTGSLMQGTVTYDLMTTNSQKISTLGTGTANSFFDVFTELSIPSSTSPGMYILRATDSANSFFDVFFDVQLASSVSLEPTTIIPITVLIAAVATLAVASIRVRRPR